MKKKHAFLIIAAILLALFLPNTALAQEKRYVVDENGIDRNGLYAPEYAYLNEDDLARLNSRAREISQKYNIDVAFVFAVRGWQNLKAYAEECYTKYLGADSTGIMAVHYFRRGSEPQWTVITRGMRNMHQDGIKLLHTEYRKASFKPQDGVTFSRAYGYEVLAYLNAIEKLFVPGLKNQLFDLWRIVPKGERLPRFIDDEALLTAAQAAELTKKLNEISERHKFDVVITVVNELDGRNVRTYATEFFEQNGFGFARDKEKDGIILLLAVDSRAIAYVTFGYGLTAFTAAGQEYLDRLFLPHLKDSEYHEAFTAFANGVDDFLIKAKAGEPYTEGNIPPPFYKIVIRSLGIIGGLLIIINFFLSKFLRGAW